MQIAAPVSLTEQFVETSPSIPQSAMDGLIQIFSLLRFAFPALVHAYKPSTGAAPDDLTNFSCHGYTCARVRHTSDTR